jgi:assimilatory nitrate reductase catalytic subunit
MVLVVSSFMEQRAASSIELRGTARLLSTRFSKLFGVRLALLALCGLLLPLVSSSQAALGIATVGGPDRGARRPLSLLRHGRAEAHDRTVSCGHAGGRVNLKRLIGLDIAAERYAYTTDPTVGFVSAQKAPDRWVPTTCGYCSVGCGMFIGVKDGRAVSVRGNPDHPANRGWLCPKGLSEHHTLDAPNRARTPLVRDGDTLAPTSWDHALTTMVNRFRSVQAEHGPQSVGVISTGQLVTEEFYALGKLVQLGFGTSNYCGNTTLCMATAVSGYKRSFGSDGPPGCYEDFERADVIILVGANIADNHPILCRRLALNPSTTLIVVDPRVTKTAMMAEVHLPVLPRSDLALINGLIHEVIKYDLLDHAYIDAHTTGFDELRESVRPYTPERVAELTGLAPAVITETALTYGRAKAALIAWTMGVNHSTKGTETVNAINNLSLITGNIGRAGAAPLSITGQCNAMGTREAGFTSAFRAIGSSRTPAIARPSPRCGMWRSIAFPSRAALRIRTSSRRFAPARSARSGSLVPIRSCRSRTSICSNSRSSRSTASWCRTASIPRPHPSLPTSCCRRRSGVRRKAPYTNTERRVSKAKSRGRPAGRRARGPRHFSRSGDGARMP